MHRVAVVCPAFVSDCLETLEEIGVRGRETFQRNGGEELTLVPCLNDNPRWITALEKMVTRYHRLMKAPEESAEEA